MKMWAFLFFLLPVAGLAYIGWHIWAILPLHWAWKTLVIIGRDDRTNLRRKSVMDLVAQVDTSKYTILLDHQPYTSNRARRRASAPSRSMWWQAFAER